MVDTAVQAGSFKTLVTAVKAAGLVETLKGKGPFTVFAPTDAAFAALPEGTLDAVLADKAKLTAILTYHVVPGRVMASDVVSLSWAPTVEGGALRVVTADGGVSVDGARVVKTDIRCSNGVIHVIDKVMMPRANIVDTAVGAGDFATLVTAVKAAGLVETLKGKGPFTVFAPRDAAFAKLPKGTIPALLKDKAALTQILTYHVVPGRLLAADVLGRGWLETVEGRALQVRSTDGGAFVDGARIVATDILAGNGVIHVIDSVVQPRPDLIDTALAAGSFKTLAKALQAAGLIDALKGKGPFTVFAPTDAAFAKLPAGTLEALLADKKKLAGILTFHVVSGRVMSSDIPAAGVMPASLQGQKLDVKPMDGAVKVNGASVVQSDILAGNGVIHVIDRVILPR